MKFFNGSERGIDEKVADMLQARQDEKTVELIRICCSNLAESTDKIVQDSCSELIHSMIELRVKENLPPYSFNNALDYDFYTGAIAFGNVYAIKIFSELGLNPFEPTNLLHNRLFEGDNCVKNTLELIKKLLHMLCPT